MNRLEPETQAVVSFACQTFPQLLSVLCGFCRRRRDSSSLPMTKTKPGSSHVLVVTSIRNQEALVACEVQGPVGAEEQLLQPGLEGHFQSSTLCLKK